MLRNDLNAEYTGETDMASIVRLACAAIVLLALNACAPYTTTPKPSAYVHVLPLPQGGTLHDILVRDGKPVGEQDPTTPDDPTVRILHGNPLQAQDLFKTLSQGGTPMPSAVGNAFRLPDGAIVVYYESDVPTDGKMSIGSVTIFVFAADIPVSQLRFYIPFCGNPRIGGVVCPFEGGGGM